MPRRALTEADVHDIVRGEIAERVNAATAYAAAGRTQRAERLIVEARILAQAAGIT